MKQICALVLSVLACSGCTVVSVAGTAVSTTVSVAGTVVDDHDEADAGQPGRRRHGLADAIGFVPRRDDHRDVIALGPS